MFGVVTAAAGRAIISSVTQNRFQTTITLKITRFLVRIIYRKARVANNRRVGG